MINLRVAYALHAILAAALSVGCGTIVGNPKSPGGEDGDTPPNPAQIIALPAFSFDFPDAVTALGGDADQEAATDGLELARDSRARLAQPSKYTLLHGVSHRIDRMIKAINTLGKQLDADKVQQTGAFEGKGADGKLSGYVAETTSVTPSDYDFEAVICHNDVPFLHLQWSEDGKKLSAARDFGLATDSGFGAFDFKSSLTITKADSVVVDVRSQGAYPQREGIAYDGKFVTEHTTIERGADLGMTMKTIADYYPAPPSDGKFEGDLYLVGRLDSAGVGEMISYFKPAKILCRHGFNEDDPELFQTIALLKPGWCLGQAIGNTEPYTREERLEALSRLSDVGINRQSSLGEVLLPPGLKCRQ